MAIFAAAGNRIGPTPPSTIVYPARFNRVVAVCGVTAEQTPYFKEGLHRKMQGCFGPPAKMSTAIAAYTPNTPWAILGCHELITSMAGGPRRRRRRPPPRPPSGSSTTPAAPGLHGWQKVEAVRHALFSSADRTSPTLDLSTARACSAPTPPSTSRSATDLPKTAARRGLLPRPRLLGVLEAAPAGGRGALMYEVEALQIYEQSPDLQRLTGGADYQQGPARSLHPQASRRRAGGLPPRVERPARAPGRDDRRGVRRRRRRGRPDGIRISRVKSSRLARTRGLRGPGSRSVGSPARPWHRSP